MPANFAKTYLEYCGDVTNAPDIYHRFAAVAMCCAALGNNVWVQTDLGPGLPSALDLLRRPIEGSQVVLRRPGGRDTGGGTARLYPPHAVQRRSID